MDDFEGIVKKKQKRAKHRNSFKRTFLQILGNWKGVTTVLFFTFTFFFTFFYCVIFTYKTTHISLDL